MSQKGWNICINELESFSFFSLLQENEINFSSSAYTEKSKRGKETSHFTYFLWMLSKHAYNGFVSWLTSFYFLFSFRMEQFCVSKCGTIFLLPWLRTVVCEALQMTQWNIIKYVRASPRERNTVESVAKAKKKSEKVYLAYGDIF